MTTELEWKNKISKASAKDLLSVRDHLLRLDRSSLYSRFGNVVTEEFLIRYTEQSFHLQTAIFVCADEGKVRGIGELRRLGLAWCAEATLSVESPFRDQGIGSALMAAANKEAQAIGMRQTFMCFDARNGPMRRITEKFEGSLSYEGGDCIAQFSIKPEKKSGARGVVWVSSLAAIRGALPPGPWPDANHQSIRGLHG